MKNKHAKKFAAKAVARHDNREGERLLNCGPQEQVDYVASKIQRFDKSTPLTRVKDMEENLDNRGAVPVHFMHGETRYLLLSEIAEAVDWPIQTAVKWATQEAEFALRDQREADEERGDGLLGYDCMRDYIDLGVDSFIDDPEAKPDGGGQRWSQTGDWLISHRRLEYLLMLVGLHHERPALRRIS